MQMDVEVGGRAKTLDEGDSASVGCAALQFRLQQYFLLRRGAAPRIQEIAAALLTANRYCVIHQRSEGKPRKTQTRPGTTTREKRLFTR